MGRSPMPSGMNYSISIYSDEYDFIDDHTLAFIESSGRAVSGLYGGALNWQNFDVKHYFKRKGAIVIVWRGEKPVAAMLVRRLKSALDPEVRILYQDLLYAKPGNGRAVKILLRWLIDFGKRHADHIITCVAEATNIKPRSLERLGFKKLEELYRMRV